MPLALSPNGQWVLATRDYPKPSLVLLRVGSEEVKDLTKTGVATFLSGLWAGDNNVIFVAMAEDGSSQSYIQPINGGSARPITAPEIRVALVSPDGTEVVAYGQLSDEYYRLPISGGALTPLYGPEPGDELLQWGLDNCLYVRGEREDQLFRIDLATGTRKPFKSLSPDPVGLVGIGTPRISPDGGTLVYNHWNADGELHWFDGAL
jgi:hypothetical protein